MAALLQLDGDGLYCAAGDFHIDPWNAVPRALITHAHADHFARGCGSYLVAAAGERLFRLRLGHDAPIETLAYGEQARIHNVTVSFHPAGHILGSAQIRVEHAGEVWIASGDYKRDDDPTCAPFEVVPCDTFITEATFGLPIYRWGDPNAELERINSWWRRNAADGRASVIYGYALGKAQRVIAGLDPTIGTIYTHGSVERLNAGYRESGIALPPTMYVGAAEKPDYRGSIIVAPVSARGTAWTRRFGNYSSAFASGWMRIRGARRRRAVDRGFVVSDHADWSDLIRTIKETGASRVLVTHGYVAPLSRWLNDHGIEAYGLQTRYEGGESEAAETDLTPEG